MRTIIPHLNYLAVIVVTIVGFLIGWLWYGVVFGKAWMAEMKITPEMVEAEKAKGGMGACMMQGFALTLIGTFGLAAVIAHMNAPNWKHGAAQGLFVGVFIVAARMVNGGVWEKRSWKLQAINAAHEVVLFTVQGAIFGAWR